MKKMRTLVRYLDISDGNMQEGSFRCDANVSVRPAGQEALGTRAELKNLNSFRFIERAINFEIERQIDILEEGGEVVQETRLYDADRDETRPMRSKEEANDYRYFPDPDLLPIAIDPDYIDRIRESLPELPDARRIRFVAEYGLKSADSEVLTATRELADYFESAAGSATAAAQTVSNWVLGEIGAALNRDGTEIAQSRVSPQALAGLLDRIEDGTISGKIAKEVFEAMWRGEGSAGEIIEAHGLRQITDSGAIEGIIATVLAANPTQVEEYRAGKTKVLGFLVGQVMKASQGKANPGQVNKILKEKLGD